VNAEQTLSALRAAQSAGGKKAHENLTPAERTARGKRAAAARWEKRYQSTYHRDGDVTYWSVYQQRWIRCEPSAISDQEYAAMSPHERERTMSHKRHA
jgi:hypothetical protein